MSVRVQVPLRVHNGRLSKDSLPFLILFSLIIYGVTSVPPSSHVGLGLLLLHDVNNLINQKPI